MVEAPADFDFRLRARLATESNRTSYHLKAAYWPFARTSLAAVAVLVLLLGGLIFVRHFMNQRESQVIAEKAKPLSVEQKPTERIVPKTPAVGQSLIARADGNVPKIKAVRLLHSGAKPKRSIVAADFSNVRAQVVTANPSQAGVGGSPAFPIDASSQPLKVSLDDGRGNARTISVPTISFGSQRVLQNANQFAPKGVW
jgi:hypothetical protein